MVGLISPAYAQQLEGVANLQRNTAEGVGGARVGENVYLRLGVLAEAGFDSNVFYNDTVKRDSPTLQVTPHLVLTNAGREGQAPPVQFGLGASLLYREYLSDDTTIKTQRAFNPSVNANLAYQTSPSFSLALTDTYSRLEDPPYTPGGATILRDANIGILDMRITPGGGRLQNTIRYTNAIDIFEAESASFANRMIHDLLLGVSWKWLPKTALFLEGGVGYIQMLNEQLATAAGKADSLPYRVVTGLRGLLTPKLSVSLGVGFQDSIYDSNVANPTGFSNLYGTVALTYRLATLTSFVLGYEHTIRDSPLVGNFYDLDAAAASLNQQIGAFVLRGYYLYEFRRYHGIQQMIQVSRRDHLQRAGVQADYFLQRWFFAGIGFSAQVNRSSFGAVTIDQTPADYTKFLVLGRVGITY